MTADNTIVNHPDELRRLGEQWAAAELYRDTAALDTMATGDFVLVGPRGFVLTKQQWLERYDSGDLVNQSFSWTDVQLPVHATVAVAIGVQTQKSAYRGQPSEGRFRVTQVWLDDGGQWRLASIHLSPMAEGA